MNPLMVEALGSIVRAGLNVLAGYLVTYGIWTSGDAEKYVAAAALAILSIAWSVWQKYGMRGKLVTALAMPSGASENDAHRAWNDPTVSTPPVTLPKDQSAGHVSPRSVPPGK